MKLELSAMFFDAVKISDRSALCSLMSEDRISNTAVPRDYTKIHQLFEFMFDKSSPND
jgi:hypothetical protein